LSSRLIDSDKGFSPVYAIYRHEYLGCLISSHVVQELPNGRLSLQHQGLMLENMDQFAHKLDQRDQALVGLIAKLSEKALIRKFNIRTKTAAEFFAKHFTGELQKMIQRYVGKIMDEIIRLLPGKLLFVMANDGYPANKPVQVLAEKASIRFHLDRRDQGTLYYPKITLAGEELRFDRHNADILCDVPCWVMVDHKVFTFDQAVEGRKLQPFLNKGSMVIAPQTEDTFFRTFGRQVVRQYEVRTIDLPIIEVREPAQFKLYVINEGKSGIELNPMVQYGQREFKAALDGETVLVELEQSAQGYSFIKVFRDVEAEREQMRLLQSLIPSQGLLGMNFLNQQDGLAWLSGHVLMLEELGFEVIQQGSSRKLAFEVPEIVMDPVDAGDWLDIHAYVLIRGFRIPFMQFRGHILRGQRDYTLPDKHTIILPEAWFTEYRHLVEIAEKGEGEVLSIRKYQAVVLQMSSGISGLREKMERLIEAKVVREVELPTGLQATLRPYQKAGYEWLSFLRDLSLGGILADDMGLGKTLQALSLLLKVKEENGKGLSLIVMPTSLVYNWLAEARKFAPSLKIMVHVGLNRARDTSAFIGYDIVLTTYGLLRSDLELFKALTLTYLILDESQMIKNPASKTATGGAGVEGQKQGQPDRHPSGKHLDGFVVANGFPEPGIAGLRGLFPRPLCHPHREKQCGGAA
jgi:hypothetical protein